MIDIGSRLPQLCSRIDYVLFKLDSVQPEPEEVSNLMYLSFYDKEQDVKYGQEFPDTPLNEIKISDVSEVKAFEFLDA